MTSLLRGAHNLADKGPRPAGAMTGQDEARPDPDFIVTRGHAGASS
jgi:hypothetical protein